MVRIRPVHRLNITDPGINRMLAALCCIIPSARLFVSAFRGSKSPQTLWVKALLTSSKTKAGHWCIVKRQINHWFENQRVERRAVIRRNLRRLRSIDFWTCKVRILQFGFCIEESAMNFERDSATKAPLRTAIPIECSQWTWIVQLGAAIRSPKRKLTFLLGSS